MLIHELTREQCRNVLSRSELGRLACSHRDQPYLVPIHFSFDPDRNCLYAFSTIGQKIQWMRENPRVCLEVDEIHDKGSWTTVLAFGRYEELSRQPEEGEAMARAEALLTKRRDWWLPAAGKVGGREHQDVVVYR